MITAKKARALAMDDLNRWEKIRKEMLEGKLYHNCYSQLVYGLDEEIKERAKQKKFVYSFSWVPHFSTTQALLANPSTQWFDYEEQVKIVNEALETMYKKLISKGYKVSHIKIQLSEDKARDIGKNIFREYGLIDFELRIKIDWNII